MQDLLLASRLALGIGLAALVALPAAAVPIAPGGASTTLTGTSTFERPELAGVVLVDRLVDYAFTDGSGSGQVQERVVRENGAGTLDFSWRIIPDASSSANVQELRIAGFTGFITDGDYLTDGLGTVLPITALTFGSPFAGDLNFRFGDPSVKSDGLPPSDESSTFFFLKTTATKYADTGFLDLAHSFAASVTNENSTFAPVASVPEPASWALLIMGFAGLGAALRRRRQQALTAA